MYPPPASDHAQPPYNQPPTGVPVGYNTHSYNPPVPQPLAHANNKVEWSTGLFDCFSDFKNCCVTLWCPCVTFGQIAEIVDRGSTSCGASGALYTLITCMIGGGCLYSCFYRTKMRRQYMLEESPCWDWLAHCCCEPCALCQEYRELQNRGFDMVLGWHGNVERRNPGVTMTPAAPPVLTMTR